MCILETLKTLVLLGFVPRFRLSFAKHLPGFHLDFYKHEHVAVSCCTCTCRTCTCCRFLVITWKILSANDIHSWSSSWSKRCCPASKSAHVGSQFTCSPLSGRQLELRLQLVRRSRYQQLAALCIPEVRVFPVFGTWYKVTTSVVVSQLKVLNYCGLLKVFGICDQILIKVTTFWIRDAYL